MHNHAWKIIIWKLSNFRHKQVVYLSFLVLFPSFPDTQSSEFGGKWMMLRESEFHLASLPQAPVQAIAMEDQCLLHEASVPSLSVTSVGQAETSRIKCNWGFCRLLIKNLGSYDIKDIHISSTHIQSMKPRVARQADGHRQYQRMQKHC